MVSKPDAAETWRAVLDELRQQVTRPAFETWLRDTTGLAYEDGLLVVGVPNSFTAEMIEGRMYSLVAQAAERVTRQPIEVSFRAISGEGSITPIAETPQVCPDSEHSHREHTTREEIALHLGKHLKCVEPMDYLRGGIAPLMETLDDLTAAYGWRLEHPAVRHPPGLISHYLDIAIERHRWRQRVQQAKLRRGKGA